MNIIKMIKSNKFYLILIILIELSCKFSSTIHHPIKKDITESIYGLGTVNSSKIFHLKIGVMSMIKKIYIEEGQSITEGSKLIEFDSIPPIKTPISGIVTSILYKANEIAFPQMNILTIMDLTDKYISLSLEEESVIRIKKGQKVRISLESMKDLIFMGEVSAVYPGENQFIVKVTSEELPEEVLPGMTADVAIEISQKKNAVLIPSVCIKNNIITLLRNGKKENITVKKGSSLDDLVEILEPILMETDEVVE